MSYLQVALTGLFVNKNPYGVKRQYVSDVILAAAARNIVAMSRDNSTRFSEGMDGKKHHIYGSGNTAKRRVATLKG